MLHICKETAVRITDNICAGHQLLHETVAYLHVPTIKQLQCFLKKKKNTTFTESISWYEELLFPLHNVVHINTVCLKFAPH